MRVRLALERIDRYSHLFALEVESAVGQRAARLGRGQGEKGVCRCPLEAVVMDRWLPLLHECVRLPWQPVQVGQTSSPSKRVEHVVARHTRLSPDLLDEDKILGLASERSDELVIDWMLGPEICQIEKLDALFAADHSRTVCA